MKKNCSSFQELDITGRFDVTVVYDNTEAYEISADDKTGTPTAASTRTQCGANNAVQLQPYWRKGGVWSFEVELDERCVIAL